MPVPSLITDLTLTAATNSPDPSESTITVDDYIRALSAFVAQLRDGTGFTDGTITLATGVRVGGATQGQLGAREAGGSGQTANASFNNAVLDSSGNCGITILSSAATIGGVVFGDPDSALAGRVQYDHATDTLELWTGATLRASLKSTGLSITGKITAITEGAGSGETANSAVNNIVIDSEDSAGITILTGATSAGQLRFGRLGNNVIGGLNYNHATDTLNIAAGGVTSLSLMSTGVAATGTITATDTIGYATGAGGAVTQGSASGKATTVTLDKSSGVITMDNASLAAGATVTFMLSNTKMIADSVVVVNLIGNGAVVDYRVNVMVDDFTAGSCQIAVTNISAGARAESVKLRFAVFAAPKV